jgi:excisionase family DNA binding protein
MDKYFTTEQVAEMLGVKNPITVRRWIMRRQITAVKIGKEYRIAQTDLDKFIEERKIKAERKKQ